MRGEWIRSVGTSVYKVPKRIEEEECKGKMLMRCRLPHRRGEVLCWRSASTGGYFLSLSSESARNSQHRAVVVCKRNREGLWSEAVVPPRCSWMVAIPGAQVGSIETVGDVRWWRRCGIGLKR